MGISYKNGSGCPDPTAYYAVRHMEAEEKRLHIRYPTGQMVLEIERFFPCTVAKARKLSPLIRRYCEKAEKEKLRQYLTKQEINYRSRIKASYQVYSGQGINRLTGHQAAVIVSLWEEVPPESV